MIGMKNQTFQNWFLALKGHKKIWLFTEWKNIIPNQSYFKISKIHTIKLLVQTLIVISRNFTLKSISS